MPVHTESDGKGGLQAKPAQATTQNKSATDKISDAAHHAAHKANPVCDSPTTSSKNTKIF